MAEETATLSPSCSSSQLDRLAACITQAISTALEASTKQAFPRPSGHRWWNQGCANTVRMLRRITQDRDHLHTSTDDKTSYLVHTLLQKASCSEDVMVNLEPIVNPALSFLTVSEREVYDAIVQPKNSTPGKDGINTLIL